MSEDTIGRVEGQVLGIVASLNKIDKMLVGNGQPGAMERITRIEENLETLEKSLNNMAESSRLCNKSNSDSIEKLTASIGELREIVLAHHKDRTLHVLPEMFMSNTKFVIMIGTIFIVLHTIIESFPDLWKWLAPIFGLPSF